MTKITLRRPDDWHLHLRDGAMLEGILPETDAAFCPRHHHANLVPPVATVADAKAYRERIVAAIPKAIILSR